MKNILKLTALVALVAIGSCKKDLPNDDGTSTTTGGYSSMADFTARNGVPTQFFLMDAATGGTFTTPQGTQIDIPGDAFVTQSNQPVSGNVVIEFKDIYKKSDMLLSDKPTMMSTGEPLKSGGEFYINAVWHNQSLKLVSGKHIDVGQPAITGPVDPGMTSFVMQQNANWALDPSNTVTADSAAAFGYIFSLYQMDSAIWCNSDNSSFFSNYPQTVFTTQPNYDLTAHPTTVYLVFQGVNSVIHVYQNGTSFPYNFAPVGLPCTVIALSVTGGNLYASFTPTTITANGTVTISPLVLMTNTAFKSQLNTLN